MRFGPHQGIRAASILLDMLASVGAMQQLLVQ